MFGGEAVGIESGIEGQYLLDALFAVGPTDWTGDREGPITWQELRAYGEATAALAEAWEYEAVMAMSRAYFRAKQEGRDVHCIAPVDREDAL